jgi:DNA-3-methyladenine glycosylase II
MEPPLGLYDRRMTPEFWPQAKRTLSRRDPILRKLVKSYPDAELGGRGDAFQTLARSIVGQQISVKAAQSIWNRFAECSGAVTPAQVAALAPEAMRACGLSGGKVKYLHDLAAHFSSGSVKPRRWPKMTDDAIIEDLVRVKGIGRWTVEMPIFHLQTRRAAGGRPGPQARDGAPVQRRQAAHEGRDARNRRAVVAVELGSDLVYVALARSLVTRMPAEALLFDLGGVIMGLDWDRAFQRWGRASHVPPEALATLFAFDEPYERHERGEIGELEYYASLRRSLAIDIDDSEFRAGWDAVFTEPVHETVALLEKLKDRVPLYAFSNSNAAHRAVLPQVQAGAGEFAVFVHRSGIANPSARRSISSRVRSESRRGESSSSTTRSRTWKAPAARDCRRCA